MKIDIITIFPKMFVGPFAESMIKRAQDKGLVTIKIHDLRNWARDAYKTVDDRPYGGGPGMILMVEPIDRALEQLKSPASRNTASRRLPIRTFREPIASAGRQNSKGKTTNKKSKVILLTPQGKVFNQKKATQLSKLEHLVLIAGHYEGVDERVRKYLVDEEISIGDYVLTGGELPTMVLVDAVVRLIPGLLKKEEALVSESFSNYRAAQILPKTTGHAVAGNYSLLEYPQYTRPEVYRKWRVPKVLLSGNHRKIAQWKEKQAFLRTKMRRPDLLATSS